MFGTWGPKLWVAWALGVKNFTPKSGGLGA